MQIYQAAVRLGAGEPVLFLHSYGPGTTAWITFHKTVGALSQHFRCILMDLPTSARRALWSTARGHALQARTAVALLDALGIARALGRQLAGRSVGAIQRRDLGPDGRRLAPPGPGTAPQGAASSAGRARS
jgi:pimeloyl-ACP methyl ester carboxylesterase